MEKICEHGILKRSCYTCDLKDDKKDLYKVVDELIELACVDGRITEYQLRKMLEDRYPHLF